MPATATVEPQAVVARSDSRTLARALGDLRAGFAHRELWAHLGWQDIKQRYRRSVLGPIWISISMGVTALAMGLLYSVLFQADIAELLPHITVGLIVWALISNCIIEGSEVFVANEGLIKQLPSPLSVHIYRLVWRQLLLLGHNMVIWLILLAVFRWDLHWTAVMAIPALALLVVNGVWVAIVFGIVATRYRDISPILGSVVQLLFFMTPIVWSEKVLLENAAATGNGAIAERVRIAEINPLLHFLDIIRAPLLGEDQQMYHWVIVLGITVLGWALALLFLRNYRARVAYWV